MISNRYIESINKIIKKIPFKLTDIHLRVIKKMLYTMENSGKLLIEAPTGWGKTYLAALAMIIYNINDDKKIIFSSKTLNILLKTFQIVKELTPALDDANIKPILFLGKEHLCPYSIIKSREYKEYIYMLCESLRHNSLCKYYINYLSNREYLTDFITRNWKKQDKIISEKEYINDSDICIYYAIKNSLYTSSIILTPFFNILYNDQINQESFFKINNKQILIIDEIHNLPRYHFDTIVNKISSKDIKFCGKLCRVLYRNIIEKKIEKTKLSDIIDVETLYNIKLILDTKIDRFAFNDNKRKKLLSLYKLRLFITDALLCYTASTLYFDRLNKVIYLVPEYNEYKLSTKLNDYYAIIGLSATLTPISEYSQLLFNNQKNVEHVVIKNYPDYLPKPKIYISKEYTSRYVDRTISMLERVAKKIYEITKENGSTAVYSASYELSDYLENELKRIINQKPVESRYIKVVSSKRHIDIKFNELHNNERLIVLSSQRGGLSEGIDLPPQFKNIVIYGLSIPPKNLEDYLYTKYVMNKPVNRNELTEAQIQSTMVSVIQSIGRVLRTGNNTVNIYLYDWRFRNKRFKKYIPDWFKKLMETNN